MSQIAEHSVDLELLPARPLVLDAGASDLVWSRAVKKVRPQARIVAVEPNTGYPAHAENAVDMRLRAAIVGEERAAINYAQFSVPCRNFVTTRESVTFHNEEARIVSVPAVTIGQLMKSIGVDHWDLVKLDIEGAEFKVLENWPGPIADQITVEFHDNKDPNRWNAAYFEGLLSSLATLGYEAVKFELSNFGQQSQNGHWDSLFVLRPEFRR